MKGDFSRWSFDPTKHFSRVLMQQGRVQLDADWNEQASIFLDTIRTLAADLIGQHGGPEKIPDITGEMVENQGFAITPDSNTFTIGNGRYYVDGILVANDDDQTYNYENQPHCAPGGDLSGTRLVYLDVWERHITYLEDEDRANDPNIREVALGGVDTTTRARVVWQVKVTESEIGDEIFGLAEYSETISNIQSVLDNVTQNITAMGWLVDEARTFIPKSSGDQGGTSSATGEIQAGSTRTLKEVLTEINSLLDALYTGSTTNEREAYITQLNNLINQLPADEAEMSAQMISFKRHLQILTDFIISDNFPKFDPLSTAPDPLALDLFQTNLDVLAKRIQALGVEISQLEEDSEEDKQNVEDWLRQELERAKPQLKAKAETNGNGSNDEKCIIPPDAQYRGLENRLYRVEIHDGTVPSFKWSRENGSIAFRIERADGTMITLKDWWRDGGHGLVSGDWVEIINDDLVLDQQPGIMAKVTDIDDLRKTVTVSTDGNGNIPEYDEDSDNHPLLRRWESNAIVIDTANFDLEDGIEIEFDDYENSEFRAGDYWLIPARTEIGNVIWPGPANNPDPMEPHGIDHHYAPLAIIEVVNNEVQVHADCRRIFEPLGKPILS